MSIEKTPTGAWRVRWREGTRNRSRVVGTKGDAIAFDAEIRRRRRLGEIAALDLGKATLSEFAENEWWPLATPSLAPKTRVSYASLFDVHIAPDLGHVPLRDLDARRITRWHAALIARGVGPVAARKALILLGGILERAVEWQWLQHNPARNVRRRPLPAREAVTPLTPAQVEVMRAASGQRDAALFSVLAYAGLRPGEALALRWGCVGNRAVLVDRSVSMGELRQTKTGQRRSVRLLAPLSADLAEWRMASGRPDPSELVFPGRAGAPWSEEAYKSWGRRAFRRAYTAAGIERTRPYALRHSFCSLLVAEGHSVVEVARQLGHSPTLTLETYAHVFAEFEGKGPIDAEAVIRAARGDRVALSHLSDAPSGARHSANPEIPNRGDRA